MADEIKLLPPPEIPSEMFEQMKYLQDLTVQAMGVPNRIMLLRPRNSGYTQMLQMQEQAASVMNKILGKMQAEHNQTTNAILDILKHRIELPWWLQPIEHKLKIRDKQHNKPTLRGFYRSRMMKPGKHRRPWMRRYEL